MKRLPLLLLFLCPYFLSAQYNSNFNQEYFFGRLPSAKTEALGGADVAIGGTVMSIFQNPAAIGSITNQQLDLSTGAPFFVLRESDYYFAGYAQRINDWLVAALSLNRFAIGQTTFEINLGTERYEVDNPRVNNVALTLAAEPIEGLQAGVNINLFNWKYINDIGQARSLPIDLGAIYSLDAGPGKLSLGASATSLIFGKINFEDPLDNVYTQEFPRVLRIGGAYQGETEFEAGNFTHHLAYLVTIQYQNVLNNDYRGGLRLGLEGVLWRVLALRVGYFRLNEDDNGLPNENFGFSRGPTYGFGLIIPLKLGDGFPDQMRVDYTSLPQPQLRRNSTRLPNSRTFSFQFIWTLPNS
ncbi:MAG: hypothetical protein AAFR61_20430 [Bacteroidota bacterium]